MIRGSGRLTSRVRPQISLLLWLYVGNNIYLWPIITDNLSLHCSFMVSPLGHSSLHGDMRGTQARKNLPSPSRDNSEVQVGQLRSALEAAITWATGREPEKAAVTAMMQGCARMMPCRLLSPAGQLDTGSTLLLGLL